MSDNDTDFKQEIDQMIARIDAALEAQTAVVTLERLPDIATGAVQSDVTTVGSGETMTLQLEAARLMLSAMSATMLGECRAEEPFKPLRPIIDEHGKFKWCCTHTPPHCSGG
ncbi:MAG: hypothetical protein AAFQ79_17800 [Pseudomonadota bacterium]